LIGKRRIGGDRKMWVVVSYKKKTGKSVNRWAHVVKKVAKKKAAPKKVKVDDFRGGMMRAIGFLKAKCRRNPDLDTRYAQLQTKIATLEPNSTDFHLQFEQITHEMNKLLKAKAAEEAVCAKKSR
jgi:hypothetical protein